MPPESRPRRTGRRRTDAYRLPSPGQWIMLGMAIGLIVGGALAFSFTQTNWGRAQVLEYTLRTLGGRFNGVLEADRLAGNLFTGARVYGLSLTDHDGVPLAIADSAYIQYRIATFVGGDVVITRLLLYDAEINLVRMPGDTAWNYQEILRDPSPEPSDPADAGATLIERMQLHRTRISIRSPLEPNPRLSAAQQRREMNEILADTSRWMVEEVPGGYVRTMAIDVHQAALRELFVGPDQRGGIYLELDDARTDVRLWRDPPLEVRSLRAQLHLQDGLATFQAPAFELPATRGEAVGTIDLTGDRPLYDVHLNTPAFALSDLRWLYPWLPDEPAEGRGSARLWLQERPDDLFVYARDLVLEMPGTRVAGRFGMVTGEEVRFVDVDLEAEPLDVDAVERLLPAGIPIEGLVIGGAVIRGES